MAAPGAVAVEVIEAEQIGRHYVDKNRFVTRIWYRQFWTGKAPPMATIDRKTVLGRINDKYAPHGCFAIFNGKGGVDVVCQTLGPIRRHAKLRDLATELSVLAPGEEVKVVMPSVAQHRP